MKRHAVIHAHFYQPPRENPEFDEIDAEASAAPFHDWNQRIERECYRAVVAARLQDSTGRISGILNTLEWISFNVGPTLCEWLEDHAPDTYRAILAADRSSCERLGGHGNAIAHPYHHVILPLASRRDKVTEVRWGIRDFERRFGRAPEGMWLPETAVDDETLDVLAQEHIRFATLAPHQLVSVPSNGQPGRYRTAAGREIAVFAYDGDLSHGIAFGGLIRSADKWVLALEESYGKSKSAQLRSMATDGETYGHHHKFAEMALAQTIVGARKRGIIVENYASYLDHSPPAVDVELVAPSSWSCSHGVDRWQADCGCRMDGGRYPSQAWRAPLRAGLKALASEIHACYEREGAAYFKDSWAVRDEYVEVLRDSLTKRRAWLHTVTTSPLDESQSTRALELLEMERDALRMFTSCAWFFDDIGGLEPKQVLRYARRALDHMRTGEDGARVLRATLAEGLSNDPTVGTGADVYDSLRTGAKPAERIAAAAKALHAERLPVERHLPNAYVVREEGSHIVVVDQRTGATATLQTNLLKRTPSRLVYEVEGRLVSLAEFPEHARHAVRAAMRNALLPVYLTTDELAQLATGEVSLRGLVAVALTRAVQRLTDGFDAGELDQAHGVLDLFEQLEEPIPFDAQTAFWQRWCVRDPDHTAALQVFGERLGFSLPTE